MKAIFELHDMYTETSSSINPARMAINVLVQFPLDKWPAAVRLLKQQHAPQRKIEN